MNYFLLLLNAFLCVKAATHFCDDVNDVRYSVAACEYSAATSTDPCLVYQSEFFCIRCMVNTVLTPMWFGQFCSFPSDSQGNLIAIPSSVVNGSVKCRLATYHATIATQGTSYLNTIEGDAGTDVIVCYDPLQLIQNPQMCTKITDTGCTVCKPGYYRSETRVGGIYECSAQFQAQIGLDIFVFSQDGTLQPVAGGDGKRFDTAYKFIAQAVNDVYQGVTVDSTMFSSVSATIWIGRGVHHFFFCPENAVNTLTTVCSTFTDMPFSYPLTNNVKLTFKALDCYQRNSYFRSFSKYGSSGLFEANCVDVRGGEKPEIRLHSSYSYFNVTNSATFENLHFTGVDMLATSTCDLSYVPVRLCTFTEEPSPVIEPLQLGSVSSVPTCNYNCQVAGYDTESLLNFTRSHDQCRANTTRMAGTPMCTGVPYHSDYFTKEASGVFTRRHQVLFNLYAFDGLSSQKLIIPELKLVNCEFSYFLTNQESFINIETNNLNIGGVDAQGQTNVSLIGVDAGAVIEIQESIFRDSKFCKGLIVYRAQKALVNETITQRIIQPVMPAQTSEQKSSLTITMSKFQNLGFTQTLDTVSVASLLIDKRVSAQSLQFEYFLDHGIVLNLDGFIGNILINQTLFNQNMYNIPGLAYQQHNTKTDLFSKSSIKSDEQFFQNNQLSCWGRLLPLINQTTELYGVTESFNILHLRNVTNVTIIDSDFDQNVGFDGNIFIDQAQSVKITKTRFKKNMSYLQANAVTIYNVSSVVIDDSFFFKNQGWLMTRAGAAYISNSSQVYISRSQFESNSAGNRGTALTLSNNGNLTITNNKFIKNGPTMSQDEQIENTPYFHFLQKRNQTSVFYHSECQNEFSYFQDCFKQTQRLSPHEPSYTIRTSYSEGAIHIQADQAVNQTCQITKNLFYKNQAFPILNPTIQHQQQATCIMIRGNISAEIANNQFRSHKSAYAFQIKDDARQIFFEQPDREYWEHSHATLIVMETERAALVTDNIFTDNLNWQVNTDASLLHFQSTAAGEVNLADSLFSVTRKDKPNQIDYQEISQQDSLRQGAERRLQEMKQHPQLIFKGNKVTDNAFNSYKSDKIAAGGMVYAKDTFSLIAENQFHYNGRYKFGLPMILIHSGASLIQNNSMQHLYCQSSCVASVNNDGIVKVSQNQIAFIVGGVFASERAKIVIQDQIMNHTYYGGGVLRMSGSEAEVYQCIVLDLVGDKGAFINASEGSYFSVELTTVQGTQPSLKRGSLLRATYKGVRPFKYLITEVDLAALDSLNQTDGDIWLRDAPTDQRSSLLDCSFNGLQNNHTAALIRIENSSINVQRTSTNTTVSYSQNQAQSGVLFYALNSEVTFTNIIISQSQTAMSLFHAVASQITINDSEFSQGRSDENGVFYLTDCPRVQINNTSFVENVASAMDSFMTAVGSEVYMQSVEVLRNLGQQATLSATKSSLNIRDSLFDGNTATLVTNGFHLIDSHVELHNSTIQNSQSALAQTGFFNLQMQSELLILDNSIIKNISAQLNGLILSNTDSKITIANGVSITDCESNSNNPVIQVQNSQNFTIANGVIFANHKPSVITAQSSQVYVSNSEFYNSSGSHLIGHLSSMTLSSVTIRDSTDDNAVGHGLACFDCKEVSVDQCRFENLGGKTGGAIYLKAELIKINGSYFTSNHAEQGGALFLDQTGNTMISDTKFEKNYASGDGGAILYNCHINQAECIAEIHDSTFVENQALNKGAALQYYSQNFTEISNTTFQDNQAQYGDNLGSYPYSFTLKEHQTENLLINTLNKADGVLKVVPGHNLNITITIYDQEGRVYLGSNDAVAKLYFNFEDSKNDFVKPFVTGADAVANAGIFRFDNLRIHMLQDTKSFMSLKFTNLPDQGNLVEFLTSQFSLQIESQKCPRGELYSAELMCVACELGFYMLDQRDQVCQQCFQQAFCYGGANIAPRPGYWRETSMSSVFYACKNPEACLGGNITSPMTLCAEGYGGIQCSLCQQGYQRQGFYKCTECSSQTGEIIVYAVNLSVLLLVIFALIRVQHTHLDVNKLKMIAYYKIMISHVQVMGLISLVDFKWGSTVSSLMQVWEYLARIPLRAVAPDCLLQQQMGYSDSDSSERRLLYAQIVMSLTAPLAFLVSALVFWIIYDFFKATKKFKDYFVATATVVVFIFLPTMCEFIFHAMNCQNILQDGPTRLIRDMHVQCFTGKHLLIFLLLAIPSAAIWLIIMPILTSRCIGQGRQLVGKAANDDFTRFEKDEIQRVKTRVGFVMAGFQSQDSNWQLLLDYKKALVAFFVVYSTREEESPQTQALLMILFLLINFAAQLQVKPYHSKELNQMEVICCFTQIQTLFTGLFFTNHSAQSDSFLTTLAFILLLLSQSLLLIFYYLKLRIEILKWLIEKRWQSKFILFVRTILFGVVNERKFRQRYMSGKDQISIEIDVKPIQKSAADPGFESSAAHHDDDTQHNISQDRTVDQALLTTRTEKKQRIPDDDEKGNIRGLELLPEEYKSDPKKIQKVPPLKNLSKLKRTDDDSNDLDLKNSQSQVDYSQNNQFLKDTDQSHISDVQHKSSSMSKSQTRASPTLTSRSAIKTERTASGLRRYNKGSRSRRNSSSSSTDSEDADPFGMLQKRQIPKLQHRRMKSQVLQKQDRKVEDNKKEAGFMQETFGGKQLKQLFSGKQLLQSQLSEESKNQQSSESGENEGNKAMPRQKIYQQQIKFTSSGQEAQTAIHEINTPALRDSNKPRESTYVERKDFEDEGPSQSSFRSIEIHRQPARPQRAQTVAQSHRAAIHNNLPGVPKVGKRSPARVSDLLTSKLGEINEQRQSHMLHYSDSASSN